MVQSIYQVIQAVARSWPDITLMMLVLSRRYLGNYSLNPSTSRTFSTYIFNFIIEN